MYRFVGHHRILASPRRWHRVRAFTLIELAVVTAVIACTVGLAVVRLDGVGESARLRSAARQMAMWHQTARIQAMTEGRPRIIEYLKNPEATGRVLVHLPSLQRGEIVWTAGEGFVLPDGIRVLDVVQQERIHEETSQPIEPLWRFWMGPDGQSRSYVVVLGLGTTPRAALVMDGGTAEDGYVLVEDAKSFEARRLLPDDESRTGSDTD